MWKPQPLTTLRASKACRGENFTFTFTFTFTFMKTMSLIMFFNNSIQYQIYRILICIFHVLFVEISNSFDTRYVLSIVYGCPFSGFVDRLHQLLTLSLFVRALYYNRNCLSFCVMNCSASSTWWCSLQRLLHYLQATPNDQDMFSFRHQNSAAQRKEECLCVHSHSCDYTICVRHPLNHYNSLCFHKKNSISSVLQ
jgi:hypothetical protein